MSQILGTVEDEGATLESLDPLAGPGDRHLTTTQVTYLIHWLVLVTGNSPPHR